MKTYSVQVPGSTSNLGPGFDTLGLALALPLKVNARESNRWHLSLQGYGADTFPRDERNLIVGAFRSYCRKRGLPERPLALSITNGIPCSGGLGGSAAAIAAGLGLGQLLHMGKLDKPTLFHETTAWEGHPDNGAPAIFGGLQICHKTGDQFGCNSGDLSSEIECVLAIPEERADTHTMRNILPKTWDQDVLESNEKLLSKLIKGLKTADPEGLKCSARDRIHQPYRFPKLPKAKRCFDLLNAQKWVHGAFLSGSGAAVCGWLLKNEYQFKDIEHAFKNLDCLLLKTVVDSKGIEGWIQPAKGGGSPNHPE